MSKFFKPRDVGINRYPVYDIQGKWIRDNVRDGFEFDSIDDLKKELINRGHRLFPTFEIREDTVINGLVVGWIKELNDERQD